jgi:hypothetical protein
MSRNARRKGTAAASTNVENASHAAEHYPLYRTFLMRSLDRCDTELAALVELNRSLHVQKAKIIETCGEATLLDIGQGLLQLKHDNALEGNVPHEGQDLCIDFMLRTKLRRKILNRLTRRLGRLSHAMDGEEIQPPSPPKYGDLRLYMDPKAIAVFEERWKRQEQAKKILEMRHESFIPSKEETSDEPTTEVTTTTTTTEKEAGGKSETAAVESTKKENKEREEEKQSTTEKEMDSKSDTAAVESTKEETKEEKHSQDTSTKDEEMTGAEAEAAKASSEEVDQTKSSTATDKPASAKAETIPSDAIPSEAPTSNTNIMTEQDYIATLRDYDEAYTKEIMPSTGAVKYPILDKTSQDDHNFIKYGAGVGAIHRTMSAKDKELEFKRWQTAILQRIPDQPTFQELGLENRVFALEERRKRLANEKESALASNKKKAKKEKDDSDGSDSDKQSDDDEEFEAEKPDSDDEDTEMEEKDDDSESKSGKITDKKESVPVKPVKSISLVAVPSFYEQDQKRLRMIHADLMATSIGDHARVRVGEATAEYNSAYNRSRSLFNRRTELQNELNTISYESKKKIMEFRNKYLVELASQRKAWEDRHREKALASLPSAQGINATGTPQTAMAANHPDLRLSSAGKALADIVDCVVARSESGWQDEHPIEAFQPPPEPDYSQEVLDKATGETLGDRREKLEGEIRSKLAELDPQLHASEEERKKAWRKLLKTKSDFDMPHSQVTNIGGRATRVSFNSNQLSNLPMPALGGMGTSMMPTAMYNYPMPSVASYVPPVPVMPSHMQQMAKAVQLGTSESKYSAAKVRERHSADGSVAPASEPKRDKDGKYIRPPGRGRIGMDWDEIRGVWIKLNND